MKKAIILARVSTAGQAEEELPIAGQIEACQAKAVELEADVVKVFTEDGVSGRKFKRDIFQEAVDYCGLFEIDYFIVWNTARYGRDNAVAAWTKLNLRRGGTQMVYVSQNIDTSTDEGWFLEQMFQIIDEQYSRTVSKDTIRSLMKNARDGNYNGGRVPFGYTVVQNAKRKRLAIVEHEAALVREIFAACNAGTGAKSMVLWLNGGGRLRRGAKWSKNTMLNLLQNWVYAGYTTFNRVHHATRTKRSEDEWIRVRSHPAIIPEEQFMNVQKIIEGRAPRVGNGHALSTFLFTGIARCGACGKGLQITTGKGRGGVLYSYYNCTSSIQGSGCKPRHIPAVKLDAWLMATLRERILTRDRMIELVRQIHELSGTWVKERADKRLAMVGDLRDTEKRRARLFEILEQHGVGAPNLGDLTVRLRELNAQIKALEQGLTELEEMRPPAAPVTEASVDQAMAFVEEMLTQGSKKKIREFIGSFVEKVEVRDRDAVIHYHPDRLVNVGPVEVVRSSERWLPELVRLRTAAFDLPERYWRRAA